MSVVDVLHCQASGGANAQIAQHIGILARVDGDELEELGVSLGDGFERFDVCFAVCFIVGEVIDQGSA